MKATDVSMEDSLLGTEGSLVALGELGSVSQTCKGQDKNVSVRTVRRKEVVQGRSQCGREQAHRKRWAVPSLSGPFV